MIISNLFKKIVSWPLVERVNEFFATFFPIIKIYKSWHDYDISEGILSISIGEKKYSIYKYKKFLFWSCCIAQNSRLDLMYLLFWRVIHARWKTKIVLILWSGKICQRKPGRWELYQINAFVWSCTNLQQGISAFRCILK